MQLISESDEFAFDFDLLDATKIIPEEQVPVRSVGRMVLDRNPDNFFAETEQVAFHTANLVPGIDFTNDPLLQARNFSYLDTQLIRLGGPNFSHLPVNRPVAEVRTHQHDGYSQPTIQRGKASYHKNSLGSGCPALADQEVFSHYAKYVDGHVVRARSDSFTDHYSQPRLFWRSMSGIEADHIVAASPSSSARSPTSTSANAWWPSSTSSTTAWQPGSQPSSDSGLPPESPGRRHRGAFPPALSQLNTAMDSIVSRKVAVLAADGVDVTGVERLVEALTERGAIVEVLAPKAGGVLAGGSGGEIAVDRAITTMRPCCTTPWSSRAVPTRSRPSEVTATHCISWPRRTSTTSRSPRSARDWTCCPPRDWTARLPRAAMSSPMRV